MVKHDNRLFAFGCSFTRYDTDTYADYIGKNYKEFYNYGNPGSGNAQIATTLSEKILEHDINKNDRVIVQWSSITREDRYVKGSHSPKVCNWWPKGDVFNLNNSDFYTLEWQKDWVSMEHFTKITYAYIHLAYGLLRSKNIPFCMLTMLDILPPVYERERMVDCHPREVIRYSVNYHDILTRIQPSMKKSIFNNKWPNKHGDNGHPTESQHIQYAKEHLSFLLDNTWPL